MTPKWLIPATSAVRAAYDSGRLPHALLIHDSRGAGGDWLAGWAAALALCTNVVDAPCGRCTSCTRVAASQHPDLIRVHPIEDSKQLRIEQVRGLAEELSLTSHQGGYKVGILSPADMLNRFAANALLKTLEEPPAKTLLILVASQPSRLPATILSRCQKLRVRAPARAESLEWLQQTRGTGDWSGALDLLGEAPLFLAEGDPKEISALGAETRRTLEEIAAGSADPLATAERWSRSEPELRLRCFENWLTERIRAHVVPGAAAVEIRRSAHLPRSAAVPNIRGLFDLADGVRDLRSSLEVPINRSLALEALLRQLSS
jgi:DNA polymerase III subunit delta'